jgi:DNA-binding GntR family transcriptional regulator
MAGQVGPLAAKPELLADLVYNHIRSAIVSGRLSPGDRVTEVGLANELGVSKAPVRESLLRLREIGLIEQNGGRAHRVIRSTPQALMDAYGTREALEAYTARLCAEGAGADERGAIRGAADEAHRCAVTGDYHDFDGADLAFHLAVADAAGNARITKLIEDAMALIATLRERTPRIPSAMMEVAEAHLRVCEAIDAGDADGAAREMAAHIAMIKRNAAESLLG